MVGLVKTKMSTEAWWGVIHKIILSEIVEWQLRFIYISIQRAWVYLKKHEIYDKYIFIIIDICNTWNWVLNFVENIMWILMRIIALLVFYEFHIVWGLLQNKQELYVFSNILSLLINMYMPTRYYMHLHA